MIDLDGMMRCRNWISNLYTEMSPVFGLKKIPPLPFVAIHPQKEGLTIRGGANFATNEVIITANPEDIMEYTCVHEGSHLLHLCSYPKINFWDKKSESDENKNLVKEVVADLSALLYFQGRDNFSKYLELARYNREGIYFDYVKRELKRGENRLRNLIEMHPDKAHNSIVGGKK